MKNQAHVKDKYVKKGGKNSHVVLISGAPGSGKSTLARKLAEQLRFTLVERDIILNSYLKQNSEDPSYTKGDGIQRFFRLMQLLIDEGLDLVVDGTLYAGKSEIDMPKACKNALAVNVHTRADNTIERFVQRERDRNGGIISEWVVSHIKVLEDIHPSTVDPLKLNMPMLEVDTNDGYDPKIVEITDWVKREHKKLEG